MDGGADAVFVGARFWLDGEGDGGLRKARPWIEQRRVLVPQCVTGHRVFELRDRAEVAGMQLGHGSGGLPLHDLQMLETL